MAISSVTDESVELRGRIAIARSVLGHAPLYRAVAKALRALDGASLEELAADQDEPDGAPEGEPREYLRGWHDGYDAGYAAGRDRRTHGGPKGARG